MVFMQINKSLLEESSDNTSSLILKIKIIQRIKRKIILVVITEQFETINNIKMRILKIEVSGIIINFLIVYLFVIYKACTIYIDILNQIPRILFNFVKPVLLITNAVQVIQNMIFNKFYKMLDISKIINIEQMNIYNIKEIFI